MVHLRDCDPRSLMEDHPPATVAHDPDGGAERGGRFRDETVHYCRIGYEEHSGNKFNRLKILHRGVEGGLGLKQVENLLLVPDAARASEFAEVIGQQPGDSVAIAPEVCLKQPLLERAEFVGNAQYPAAFPKLARLSWPPSSSPVAGSTSMHSPSLQCPPILSA